MSFILLFDVSNRLFYTGFYPVENKWNPLKDKIGS